ncbi:MAG: cytochrome c-type biogenesis protein [Cocleimonas sp.]
MNLNRSILVLLSLVFAVSTFAVKIEFHSFKNKQQEALYYQLVAELRCVKCQNQNLAESNAELASDMREKTYKMVVEGGSREDVVNYMTARYGDFVLYKPPLKKQTMLLWIGPPIFLFLSLFLLFRMIRKQKAKSTETMSDTDRESMRELLSSNPPPNSKKDK